MSKLAAVLRSRFEDAKTAINNRYQISSYLDSKGIHVESNKQLCCPFHDDSTPSFSVNFETNEWKCFGCQDGGHFVDIWKTYSNKYESGKYTVYSAVEKILEEDKELQSSLGFSSIYKTEEDEFDLFQKDEEKYLFDDLLSRKINIKKINTDSMKQVIDKLKSADADTLVRFVADCQNGMNEAQLVSKYYKEQNDVSEYIANLAGAGREEQADLTTAFLDAMREDS